MTDPNADPPLPVEAATSRDRRPPGLITSVILSVGLLAILGWQFSGVADDGQQVQVLDPVLHPAWKAVIVLSIAVSAACGLAAWLRRAWTMPLAVTNAAANLVAAAVVIALTVTGRLFAPTLPDQVATTVETTTEWSDLRELFLILVAGLAIWDGLDGITRARRRGTRAARRRT